MSATNRKFKMATGMVSSLQTTNNTRTILRAGETITTTAQAVADKNAKTYHHMVPGARFIMPDGLEIVFMGGVFTTADPEIISELDSVANKAPSMIYTRNEMAAAVQSQNAKLAEEAATQK